MYDGDYLLVRKVLRSGEIRNGYIVTVKHPQFGRIVKVVVAVTPETVKLAGISKMSTSTNDLGDIKKEDIDGVGVAVIPRRSRDDSRCSWFRFLKNDEIQGLRA